MPTTPTLRPADLLEPGAAVILDTETTDLGGRIIEIAVIDAASGVPLVDTLVDPQGEPINPQAQAVHGITCEQLVGAPTFGQIWAELDRSCVGRVVLAWNAPFDQAEVEAECQRNDLPAPGWAWQCLMRMDAALHHTSWRKLRGGHRALGDVRAARSRLISLCGEQAWS